MTLNDLKPDPSKGWGETIYIKIENPIPEFEEKILPGDKLLVQELFRTHWNTIPQMDCPVWVVESGKGKLTLCKNDDLKLRGAKKLYFFKFLTREVLVPVEGKTDQVK